MRRFPLTIHFGAGLSAIDNAAVTEHTGRVTEVRGLLKCARRAPPAVRFLLKL